MIPLPPSPASPAFPFLSASAPFLSFNVIPVHFLPRSSRYLCVFVGGVDSSDLLQILLPKINPRNIIPRNLARPRPPLSLLPPIQIHIPVPQSPSFAGHYPPRPAAFHDAYRKSREAAVFRGLRDTGSRGTGWWGEQCARGGSEGEGEGE